MDQDDKAVSFHDILRITRTGSVWVVLFCSFIAWLSVVVYKLSPTDNTDAAYPTGRGLDNGSVRGVTAPSEELPYGTHRVTVSKEDLF